MPWVDKSPHVRIRRRYHCDDCDYTFEMRHESPDEPMPDCPRCVERGAAAAQMSYVAPMPALTTSKSRAIALAESMMDDYGLTNMADNQRPGDTAILPDAPMQTAEREKEIRTLMEMEAASGAAAPLPAGPLLPDGTRNLLVDPSLQRENYWQGNSGGTAEQTVATQAIGKEASAAAARDGVDPVGLLERGRSSGSMPLRLNVTAAVDSSELPQPLQQAQARRGAVP